jgi:hypothetical protein
MWGRPNIWITAGVRKEAVKAPERVVVKVANGLKL